MRNKCLYFVSHTIYVILLDHPEWIKSFIFLFYYLSREIYKISHYDCGFGKFPLYFCQFLLIFVKAILLVHTNVQLLYLPECLSLKVYFVGEGGGTYKRARVPRYPKHNHSTKT